MILQLCFPVNGFLEDIDWKTKKIVCEKMTNPTPPIFDFDRLKPVTMTIIVSYNVVELNLPAIFTFLPVTEQVLPRHLNIQKKQGKIRLPPELNRPGEILSMRYDKQARGIIRSETARSFSHSIIIDLGTSERIISVKFSRTLEFTGPTSIDIAKEAAESLLSMTKQCQDDLNFIRAHRDRALVLKDEFIIDSNFKKSFDETDKRIWEIFRKQTRGYPNDKIDMFLSFMIDFNRNLYTGTLELGEFECEMANILFNLGYPIDQVPFAQIMNQAPFRCNFNNYKSASAVVVYYDYIKYDRNTGQPKSAKHTIRVNRSGHVRHSGPNLESMKEVYHAFMQRVLQHYDKIQSIETSKQFLRIVGPARSISISEWRMFIKNEEELRNKILRGDVPIAKGEVYSQGPIIEIAVGSVLTERLDVHSVPPLINQTDQTDQVQRSLTFDYVPLLATR